MACSVVAGTFDPIHDGHRKLFEVALRDVDKVIVGLTTDDYVFNVKKRFSTPYDIREENLKDELMKIKGNRKVEIQIYPLRDANGPLLDMKDIDYIVLSTEKNYIGWLTVINNERVRKGFKQIEPIFVDLVLDSDGEKMSSSKIRVRLGVQ